MQLLNFGAIRIQDFLAGTLLGLILVLLPGCRVTDIPFWGLPVQSEGVCEVQRIADVPYRSDDKADSYRHCVDLFLPKGQTNYPVVVLVHGGAWMIGDNRSCGLYPAVAEFLAGQGIGVVLPNYRQSPGCKHPEHIQDLARSVRWTQEHIRDFGGDPEKMVLVGHSAGGHLVTLLATDKKYLAAEGLETDVIRGVIGISGVYHIPSRIQEYCLGGSGDYSFHLRQIIPVRESVDDKQPLCQLPGIPIRLNVFGDAFGNDPLIRQDASPLFHVRPDLPPVLLMTASEELPSLNEMAREFNTKLLEAGCVSEHRTIRERNHNSIMFCALDGSDPVGRSILDFIQKVTTKPVKKDGLPGEE